MSLIQGFIENINLCRKQIEGGESTRAENGSFNEETYWKHVEMVYMALSKAATMLAFAFQNPPAPEPDMLSSLLRKLEENVLALVSTYYSLPNSQGLTLQKALQQSVLEIIRHVESLVTSIEHFQAGSQQQRSSAGLVWKETDSFSQLPKNNVVATLNVVRGISDLVQDALSELNEAVQADAAADMEEEEEEEGGNEPTWSKTDKEFLEACAGMVKTSKTILKKTMAAITKNGCYDSKSAMEELDRLVDIVTKLSPYVDDLVSSLYPPITRSTALDGISQLAMTNSAVLDLLRDSHLTGEEEQKWVEFLVKANQHNRDKTLACLTDQV